MFDADWSTKNTMKTRFLGSEDSPQARGLKEIERLKRAMENHSTGELVRHCQTAL